MKVRDEGTHERAVDFGAALWPNTLVGFTMNRLLVFRLAAGLDLFDEDRVGDDFVLGGSRIWMSSSGDLSIDVKFQSRSLSNPDQ
jgi:hypothetical protein